MPESIQVCWKTSHRIIPSRYPPIDLFERLTSDPSQWEILASLEGLTNDRLRDEAGDLSLVHPSLRISGPGASPIMAAFTHVGFPSRFTDGFFGVYYAGDSSICAIKESVYHRARILRAENSPPCALEMREYVATIDAGLHDIRGPEWSEAHRRDCYVASQALAKTLRGQGSEGLIYRSVRAKGHECIAVFRPTAFVRGDNQAWTSQARHYRYLWDGAEIRVVELKDLDLE